MRVLDLFKAFKRSESDDQWLAGFLAVLYGLAVPLATVFLIQQAKAQHPFLFLEIQPLASWIFWALSLFSAAVSLKKVYDFLVVAFQSKILSFLSCAAFEFAFITSDDIWFIFFFTVVAVANIIQAGAGFLSEEKKEKVKEEGIKFYQ